VSSGTSLEMAIAFVSNDRQEKAAKADAVIKTMMARRSMRTP